MKSLYLIIIILICTGAVNLSGQGKLPAVQNDLQRMFIAIRPNGNLPDRIKSNDSIRIILGNYASSDSVFRHRFSTIRSLGQITSPDSLLKILTWNFVDADSRSTYFAFLVKRDIKKGGGKVFFLQAPGREFPENTDTIYNIRNWYGALYYDLRPFEYMGNVKYVALGIDYGSQFITRKLIEVISFRGDEGIEFGAPCFSDGKNLRSRVVFEYASTAVMSLKFESEGQIVFDHLSPVSPQYRDNRQFYGPDFSFDAFVLDKGTWKYKADIDIKNK